MWEGLYKVPTLLRESEGILYIVDTVVNIKEQNDPLYMQLCQP